MYYVCVRNKNHDWVPLGNPVRFGLAIRASIAMAFAHPHIKYGVHPCKAVKKSF